MSAPLKGLYEFGPFRLDATERVLLRDGTPVELTPKAFDALVTLVENAGRLLNRDEMLRRLWPGVVVEEATLAKNIFILRRALGDEQAAPAYIETVPKHGYRFIAQVRRPIAEPDTRSSQSASGSEPGAAVASVGAVRPRVTRPLTGLGALLAASVLVAALYYFWPDRGTNEPNTADAPARLAVLPFEDLSADASQRFFGDGLTEELLAQIGMLDPDRLAVIARHSAMRYRDSTKSAREIASELRVQYMLTGSVRREAEQVRVTVHLIRTADQIQLWSASYDRDLRGVLELQGEIAKSVAFEVTHRVSPEDGAPRAAHRPVDPALYDLYLRARHLWNQRTEGSIAKAVELLNEVVARDPSFVRAHAALADCHVLAFWYSAVPARVSLARARQAAERALELDPSLAQAFAARGYANLYELKFSASRADFERSIALDPNYATAHQWYAEYLRLVNRPRDAIVEIGRAIALDPLSPIINVEAALPHWQLGDLDAAIAHLERAIEIGPHFASAHAHLAAVQDARGEFDAARAAILRARELSEAPWMLAELGRIDAHAGRIDDAREALAHFARGGEAGVNHLYVAWIHVALGNNASALASLEDAYQQQSWQLAVVRYDPRLVPLRSDPQFQSLLRRVGLPQ